jgi:hypothetical protein
MGDKWGHKSSNSASAPSPSGASRGKDRRRGLRLRAEARCQGRNPEAASAADSKLGGSLEAAESDAQPNWKPADLIPEACGALARAVKVARA